jgi:uncharacterized protein YqeY
MNLQEEYFAYQRQEEVRVWNHMTRQTLHIFCHHVLTILKVYMQQQLIPRELYLAYVSSFIEKKASLLKEPITCKKDFVYMIKAVKDYGQAVASFETIHQPLPIKRALPTDLN